MKKAERITRRVKLESSGTEVDVILRKANPPEHSNGRFPPPLPGSSVEGGARIDRDVAITLRDGAVMYCDIYRPDGATGVPAIVSFSPFGKRSGYTGDNGATGVPEGTYSAGTMFEGPDPDFWVRRGYAVVNCDARGSGYSDGFIQYWTATEGKDAAELIDYVGALPWCNGRVGMCGNSWLAIVQWFAAVEQPRHLACIAPWEGITDLYRQLAMRGGIPERGFMQMLPQVMVGKGWAEDVYANAKAHPFYDAYWQDKAPMLERVAVPTYMTAGFSHFHLMGTFEAWRRIGTKDKWLRAHREFEWPDMYEPENLADLERFYDRYLKGLHNGWELTPRIRLDVMDRGDHDHVVRRKEHAFPLPDTDYQTLYLDAASRSMGSSAPSAPSELTYDAVSGRVEFDMRFDEATELTGHLTLRLWVEARDAEDMDLFVVVQKLDEDGVETPTLTLNLPHPGAPGMLRVSHRELDPLLSTPYVPVHAHQRALLLSPGEVVPVDIAIWPTSRHWHAGEILRLVVSGHYVREPGWPEPFAWDIINTGHHVIHTGGSYDSHVIVPVIPRRRKVIPGPGISGYVVVDD